MENEIGKEEFASNHLWHQMGTKLFAFAFFCQTNHEWSNEVSKHLFIWSYGKEIELNNCSHANTHTHDPKLSRNLLSLRTLYWILNKYWTDDLILQFIALREIILISFSRRLKCFPT